jgi:hypothetical protein
VVRRLGEHRAYWGANLIPWGARAPRRIAGGGAMVRLRPCLASTSADARSAAWHRGLRPRGSITGKTTGATVWVDTLPAGARAAVASRSRGSPRIPRLSPNARTLHQRPPQRGVHQHYFTTRPRGAGRRRRQARAYVTSIRAPPREVMLRGAARGTSCHWGANNPRGASTGRIAGGGAMGALESCLRGQSKDARSAAWHSLFTMVVPRGTTQVSSSLDPCVEPRLIVRDRLVRLCNSGRHT